MSEYFKDVLALVIGTVLLMLVWLAIGGGSRAEEFLQHALEHVSDSFRQEEVAIRPASATEEVRLGMPRGRR